MNEIKAKNKENKTRPTVILGVAGLGVAPDGSGNALSLAKMSNLVKLSAEYPSFLLNNDGYLDDFEAIDKPRESFRAIFSSTKQLSKERFLIEALTAGDFLKQEKIVQAVKKLKKKSIKGHLILVPDKSGSVVQAAKEFKLLMERKNVDNIYLHLVINQNTKVKEIDYLLGGAFKLATVSGAEKATDNTRDFRKTLLYYEALTRGLGQEHMNLEEIILDAYQEMLPTVQVDAYGNPLVVIDPGDEIFLFAEPGELNQLLESFDSDFSGFEKKRQLAALEFFSLFDYHIKGVEPLLKKTKTITLLDKLVEHNEKSLLIVDSHSLPQVNEFINERLAVSVLSLSTEEAAAEVSVDEEIVDEVFAGLKDGYKNIVAVISGLAIASQSGEIKQVVKEAEKIDRLIANLAKEVFANDGQLIIFGWYGQAEAMIDMKTEAVLKEPNSNQVPLVIASSDFSGKSFSKDIMGNIFNAKEIDGTIFDIARTIATIIKIEPANNWLGKSLIDD